MCFPKWNMKRSLFCEIQPRRKLLWQYQNWSRMIICQSGLLLAHFFLITSKILCQPSRNRKKYQTFLSFWKACFLFMLYREAPPLQALPKSAPNLFTFGVTQHVLWRGFYCAAHSCASDRPCKFLCLDTDI